MIFNCKVLDAVLLNHEQSRNVQKPDISLLSNIALEILISAIKQLTKIRL